FLAVDEILKTSSKVVGGMNIHLTAIKKNMKNYGIFAASEKLLMQLGKHGANRQDMHEVIREHSLAAWAEVQEGGTNNLAETLTSDERVLKYLTKEEALALLDANEYVGDAPLRCQMIIDEAKEIL
ncbi:MAG: adenylosuccinate lyase, partial [Sphaerochaetaceae bacterium]|nr:adenylosuccinate lyase [Sphaerochaetaceae bacterium]